MSHTMPRRSYRSIEEEADERRAPSLLLEGRQAIAHHATDHKTKTAQTISFVEDLLSSLLLCDVCMFHLCTQDESRTHTPQPALPPQSSVSTNSTTCASLGHLTHSTQQTSIGQSAQDRNRTCTSIKHSHLKRARLPIPPLGLEPVS